MDELSLDGDNAKVKNYTWFLYFSTLMARFSTLIALFNFIYQCSRGEDSLVRLSAVSGGADEAASQPTLETEIWHSA